MKRKLLCTLMLLTIVAVANAQQSRFNEVKTKEAVLQFQMEQIQGLQSHSEKAMSPQTLQTGINETRLNAPALDNVKLYGYRVYSDDSQPQGFISFNSNNPAVVTYENGYTVSPNNAGAGEYHDHNLYLNTYISGTPQNFIQLTDTWAQVSSISSSLHLVDMAYDYSTDKMYGIAGSTSLYMVDLTTGAVTLVGATGKLLFTLACDLNGNLYGVSSTSAFCSINKNTGVATEIGPTGISAPYYLQSMAFDHNSGRLFWALCNNSDGKLIEIDPATGVGTDLGQIGQNSEVVMLYTPWTVPSIIPDPLARILSQPQDASVCNGESHTFEVIADGNNLSYQWYKGNNPVLGGNQNTLTITNVTKNDYDNYHVVIKNSTGTTVSNKARLWVAEPLPQHLNFTECPTQAITGQTYNIRLAGYMDITNYSWSFSNPGAVFQPESGAKNETKVTFPSTAVGKGTLTATLEHVCGNRTVTQDITVKWPTGLDDIENNTAWVGPNPAKEQLTIDNGQLTIKDVIVTDLSGKVIYRSSSILNHQLTIDCSSWVSGVYLVKVNSIQEKGNSTKVYKIIKK